jgi:hypothetical protein
MRFGWFLIDFGRISPEPNGSVELGVLASCGGCRVSLRKAPGGLEFQFSSLFAFAFILQRRKIVGQAGSFTGPGFRSLVPGSPPFSGPRSGIGFHLSACGLTAAWVQIPLPAPAASTSRRSVARRFRGPCRSRKKNAFSGLRGSTSRDQIARIFSRFFLSLRD